MSAYHVDDLHLLYDVFIPAEQRFPVKVHERLVGSFSLGRSKQDGGGVELQPARTPFRQAGRRFEP